MFELAHRQSNWRIWNITVLSSSFSKFFFSFSLCCMSNTTLASNDTFLSISPVDSEPFCLKWRWFLEDMTAPTVEDLTVGKAMSMALWNVLCFGQSHIHDISSKQLHLTEKNYFRWILSLDQSLQKVEAKTKVADFLTFPGRDNFLSFFKENLSADVRVIFYLTETAKISTSISFFWLWQADKTHVSRTG